MPNQGITSSEARVFPQRDPRRYRDYRAACRDSGSGAVQRQTDRQKSGLRHASSPARGGHRTVLQREQLLSATQVETAGWDERPLAIRRGDLPALRRAADLSLGT